MTALGLKYGSLGLLVLQNTALVLLMSYSRNVEGPLYTSSTAVATMEVMKVITCCGVIFVTSGGYKPFLRTMKIEIVNKPAELGKLALPSFLYMVQNNLLYEALSNLDPATYSVCYQLKIMTTALFSVILLKKRLSPLKWMALVLLTLGVALAELATHAAPKAADADAPPEPMLPLPTAAPDLDSGSAIGNPLQRRLQEDGEAAALGGFEELKMQRQLLGFLCVLAATCTSGFAGVWFEMILKGAKTSLWIRNVQMGLPSILFALASCYTKDLALLRDRGFFYGYTGIVWGVIVLQAVGGLMVAVVVKYADNILKAFASAVSIVTSCLLSALLFGFRPSPVFMVGTLLVSVSVFLYSKPDGVKPLKAQASKQNLPLFDSHAKRPKAEV
ncbi:nucleotide-sugar transporter-domain-containing protein [Tribonema minus]|uniref:Nucleotide-sugar transporter-domain-containing protein n=1 Tax=Tribonema minus TaxID=303371 RepID=A0A836C750_9STRA|nr:nucleotide-sugar transporter-domain-containing protein [Tribonema minus]